MAWNIEFLKESEKELKKLDPYLQKKILRFLRERVAPYDNPHTFAKPLLYNLGGLWRIRIQEMRMTFQLHESTKTLKITRIAHRREVYDE